MKNLNWTFKVSLGPHFAVAKWILIYVKGVVYIQIIRWSKSLCMIIEASWRPHESKHGKWHGAIVFYYLLPKEGHLLPYRTVHTVIAILYYTMLNFTLHLQIVRPLKGVNSISSVLFCTGVAVMNMIYNILILFLSFGPGGGKASCIQPSASDTPARRQD